MVQKRQCLMIFLKNPSKSTGLRHCGPRIPVTSRRLVTIRSTPIIQWIGLRENLQETMVFTTKYRVFL